MIGATMMVLCATCVGGTGQIWPPIDYPTMTECRVAAAELSPEPIDDAKILAMPDATAQEALAKLMAIQAVNEVADKLRPLGKLVVRCVPR